MTDTTLSTLHAILRDANRRLQTAHSKAADPNCGVKSRQFSITQVQDALTAAIYQAGRLTNVDS